MSGSGVLTITMPRLSDSMKEGTILRWLIADGATVAAGEGLVEIETDKATVTYDADAAGVLEIVANNNDTLPIGAVIARLSSAKRNATHGGVDADAPNIETPAVPDAHSALQVAPVVERDRQGGDVRAKASPVARRVAHERGVDLASITGSGPRGRIVRADVDRFRAAQTVTSPQHVHAPGFYSLTPKGEVTVQELTKTQEVVAGRMATSQATAPEFALQAEIDMERCVELRSRLHRLSGEEPSASYNDMVVKACAIALREHPRANGSYKDGRFELYSRVNVGIAVAGHDSLVVPTIFDADAMGLAQIATETRRLVALVRSGAITAPELSGGTFTVSNLGMFGVSNFTAVLNAPQAAILAVGALALRGLVVAGELVIRHTVFVTLVCDHRILYGADAARFLARVRELLEEPLGILV